jgi:hypothetical protein
MKMDMKRQVVTIWKQGHQIIDKQKVSNLELNFWLLVKYFNIFNLPLLGYFSPYTNFFKLKYMVRLLIFFMVSKDVTS